MCITVVCKQRNIPRLIYTSTVNVVFGGNPIEEGDEETVPYFPLEKVLCPWDGVAFTGLQGLCVGCSESRSCFTVDVLSTFSIKSVLSKYEWT